MAGTWTSQDKRLTTDKKTQTTQKPIGYVYEFTSDSIDGSIPVLPVGDISGLLLGCDYIPDATTPPDTVTIDIGQVDGISRMSGTLTAKGSLFSEDFPFLPFAGGLQLTLTGNSTASAKGRIVLLVSW